MEGLEKEKPAESQAAESQEREKERRVKKEKKDKKKKNKKKKGDQKKGSEEERPSSKSTSAGEGEEEQMPPAEEGPSKEKEKFPMHIFGGGARTKQTARMTAGTARLKPPLEALKESRPEAEGAVEEKSSEDRKIEELKTTEAEMVEELRLKKLWVAEREEKLRLKRDQEAAQALEEQRAVEKKSPEEVGQTTTETGKEILKLGMDENQARKGEERGSELLKGERSDERERQAGEEQPRGDQDEEMMEEGQQQETEYGESIKLVELLTRPQRKEWGGRQEVKTPEPRALDAERDIQLPDAPPPAPTEMMDTQEPVSKSQDRFKGRETWDITFKVGDKVDIEQMMQNARGEMEVPIESEFSVKRFFDIMETWPPHIRSFKIQNDESPPLLRKVLKEGVEHAK
jgi:hypothetical protein